MSLTEQGRFEIYKKKLQGICDEHNLVYTFIKDKYPMALIIKTTGEISGQLSMLEQAEEDGYRNPDARLIFSYKDGDLVYRISEAFTIGDALFNKLKNLFKNMHALWLQYFHREIIQNDMLTGEQLPAIDDDDDGDIVDEVFDEIRGDMEAIENFEADGEEGDYEYDEPDES